MRATWQLPEGMQLPLEKWEIDQVHLEFNGPQLVTLRDGERRYLALAADEDAQVERWLRVGTTSTELLALEDGALGLDEVFAKPSVDVVDLSRASGQPLRLWRVPHQLLGEEDLPLPGSLLPNNRIELGTLEASSPMLQLDMAGARSTEGPAIRFISLGDLLRNFQRLWNALAQVTVGTATQRGTLTRELRERVALSAGALAPGSVILTVTASDEELFRTIGDEYRALVGASSNEHDLVAVLRRLQVRVRSTYRDLLQVLEKRGLQLYAKWDTHRIYVGPTQARQIRARLESTEEAEEEEMAAIGFFTAMNLSTSQFEFFDLVDDETISGTVDQLAFVEDSVVVGPGTKYFVQVSALVLPDSIAGPTVRYRLKSARRVEDDGSRGAG